MSEKVIRPPPPNLCVVFLQCIPCIKIVCLVHKRLCVTRGVYVFIYRRYLAVSAGLFIAGIAVIWGAVLLSLVQLEHVSRGVWPISGPLWQRGSNILVHLNYTWREIILRCLNSPHGHQTSWSDLIWKLSSGMLALVSRCIVHVAVAFCAYRRVHVLHP